MDFFIMILCIVLSAFFSATETAFSSINRIKMISLAENDGNKKAAAVLDIVEKYDKFLTTVLVGNNIVNILLASLATIFFIGRVGDEYGTTVSTVVTTVVVLIFGEITPKSLAKEFPEKFAMFALPFVKFLMFIFAPLCFIFSLWTNLLSKINKNEEDDSITDDELLTIVKEAENEGGLDKHESELIQNAIAFDDRQALDILTPRVDVIAVQSDATEEEINKVFSDSGYSRLPVYEGSLDNIIGIIHQKDFHDGTDEGKALAEIYKKPVFVTPTLKISNLLRKLQEEKAHIAVVVDEYGGTAGIVTMEDILEELVGEIWDEHDEIVEEVTEVSENIYLLQGTVLLDEMCDLLGIKCEDSEADTVSGFIMEQLDHIPEAGETFEYENLKFEITEVVARRITEVKIEVLPVEEEEEKESLLDKLPGKKTEAVQEKKAEAAEKKAQTK
ncbi:MAG: HlyC/CorC family transporter [Ruminococcaceae bacterium]|nr:HlyC/CorC family transporter [Oscillospiraceae bacterium]